MPKPPIKIGDTFTFRKTVSESDVYTFAGITGDLSPNHVDEEEMSSTPYGGRIAHGALLVGYMSSCSTLAAQEARNSKWGVPVSLGYDRVRFLRGVKLGDTIAISYKYVDFIAEKSRSQASVEIRVGKELVCVAQHLMTWVRTT